MFAEFGNNSIRGIIPFWTPGVDGQGKLLIALHNNTNACGDDRGLVPAHLVSLLR